MRRHKVACRGLLAATTHIRAEPAAALILWATLQALALRSTDLR